MQRTRSHQAHLVDECTMPVLDGETGKTLEYGQLKKHPKYQKLWQQSYSNESGSLCQGIVKGHKGSRGQRTEGTDTFNIINYTDIPTERRSEITYTKVVCKVQEKKEDQNRTQIKIGGNHICYLRDVGTSTASLDLVKLILNSVLSHRDVKFTCFDISNFYLMTPMDRPQYVRIKLSDIPNEFINEYDLTNHTHQGWVYFEIVKDCYGLPQSGKLSNDLICTRLNKEGY